MGLVRKLFEFLFSFLFQNIKNFANFGVKQNTMTTAQLTAQFTPKNHFFASV